jgi:hypothetical protein
LPTFSQPEAAELFNVSERTIRTVKVIEREAPERIADIEAGKKTVNKVYKLIKKQEAREKAETIKRKHVENPDGLYDVIVIDPPWPMEKIERDCRPNQHGLDYPTMTEEEIHNIKIPHAKDCHVWIWTTQHIQCEKCPIKVKDMISEELDALALEYKRDYGSAGRNLDISDFVNNPNRQGIICVFGPGFSEKIADLPGVEISVTPDN